MATNTTPPATTVPPSADSLRRALTRINPPSPRAALAHLALPATDVPGIAATADATGWAWRGVHVTSTGDDAADLAALAGAGARPGDRWADLDGPTAGWVKIVRSGARRILFGTDTLFGGPLVAADEGVSDRAALACFAAWLDGGRLQPPQVLDTPAGAVLVDGSPTSIVLRAPHADPGPAADPPPLHHAVARLAAELADDLAADHVEAVELASRAAGTVDVEFCATVAGGWEILVPAIVAADGEMVGVDPAQLVAAEVAALPDGYEWAGRDSFEGLAAGRHRASGLVVLVRRLD